MISSKNKKVILIDASSYFLSFSYQDSSRLFADMTLFLNFIISTYKNNKVLFVFEGGSPLYKNEICPTYKKNRNNAADIYASELNQIINGLISLDHSVFIKSGIESQDAIGTLSHQLSDTDTDIIIVSKGTDMAQLVNEQITVIDHRELEIIHLGKDDIYNKYNLLPSQIPDYLAIAGKKSHGIPGVMGTGSKTSLTLIKEFKSLNGVYDNIENLGAVLNRRAKSVCENLIKHKDDAYLSYQLSKINTNLFFDFNPNTINRNTGLTLPLQVKKKSNVVKLFKEKSIPIKKGILFSIINTQELLIQMKLKIKEAGLFSIHVENPGIKQGPYNLSDIIGISISISSENFYIPFDFKDITNFIPEFIISSLKSILEDPAIKVVGFNLKNEFGFFFAQGINLVNDLSLQVVAFALFPEANNESVNTLSQDVIDITITNEIRRRGKSESANLLSIDPVNQGKIPAEKTSALLKLYDFFSATEKSEPVNFIINELDNPICKILGHMEQEGVLLDVNAIQMQDKRLTGVQKLLEKEIYATVGKKFNIDSNTQRETALLEYKKPNVENTELLNKVSEYRAISTLKSRYFKPLPKSVNTLTGKVHTSYQQTVTKTGRLSSKNPNLQSIPVKSTEGRKIREAFIVERKYKYVSIDYSQIELRILAHFSQDALLISAFNSGVDIHKKTASEIFNVDLEHVSDDMRRIAKSINFGIIYGKTAYSLSLELDITYLKAKQYIESYFTRYKGVKSYIDSVKLDVMATGYITTVLGRKLYYPLIKSSDKRTVSATERQSINAVMQGSASDLIKKAMINVFDWIQINNKDVKMLMQVHDELIFKIQEDVAEVYSVEIANIMENAINLSVPLIADIGIGNNWSEAH